MGSQEQTAETVLEVTCDHSRAGRLPLPYPAGPWLMAAPFPLNSAFRSVPASFLPNQSPRRSHSITYPIPSRDFRQTSVAVHGSRCEVLAPLVFLKIQTPARPLHPQWGIATTITWGGALDTGNPPKHQALSIVYICRSSAKSQTPSLVQAAREAPSHSRTWRPTDVLQLRQL